MFRLSDMTSLHSIANLNILQEEDRQSTGQTVYQRGTRILPEEEGGVCKKKIRILP